MEAQKAHGKRILSAIEGGMTSVADIYKMVEDQDPSLVYFVVKYLRKKYPPTHQAADAITSRIVELTGTYDDVRDLYQKGEKDILTEWFEDNYSWGEFRDRPEEFIDLIIEKIEG